MKKIFTFIFAATLCVGAWGGEETIQIGSGTGTTPNMPLVTGSSNYNHITQQLYLANEIGGVMKKGDITALSFYSSTFSATYSDYSDSRRTNFKIFITTVPSTTVTLSNWIDKGSEVYFSPQQTINSGTWTTFDFQTTFTWNGIDNIVITVLDESNKRAGIAPKNFYAFDAPNRGLYATTNNGTTIDFTKTPTSANKIPQIRFNIETSGSSPTITINPTSVNLGTFDKQYEVISKTFVVKGSDLTNDIFISSESADVTISPTSITKEAIAEAGDNGIEVTVSNTNMFDFTKSHKVTVASTGAISQELPISATQAEYQTQISYTNLYNSNLGSYSSLAGPTSIASVDASAQKFVLGTTSQACTIDYSAVPGTYVALGKVSNLKVKKTGTGTFKAFAFDYSVSGITISETNEKNNITYETVTNVTLKRTLVADGYYSTICLPFAVTAEQIADQFGEGTKIQDLTEATLSDDDMTLTLSFTEVEAMEAGKPYLILPTEGGSEFIFNNVTLTNEVAPVEFANLHFIGTFNQSTLETGFKNTLLLGGNNELGWANNSGAFKGLRAYFRVIYHNNQAPERLSTRMLFNNTEATTNLIGIKDNQPTAKKVLLNNQLYIINNGKKYNTLGLDTK